MADKGLGNPLSPNHQSVFICERLIIAIVDVPRISLCPHQCWSGIMF